MSIVDRRGHGNNDDVGGPQLRRIRRGLQQRSRGQLIARYFTGRVDVSSIGFDLFGRHVQTDRPEFLAEFDGQRQTHIAQTDDRNDLRPVALELPVSASGLFKAVSAKQGSRTCLGTRLPRPAAQSIPCALARSDPLLPMPGHS